MRDKSHEESIERWAEYVRKNPEWKRHLKPFIDSQITIARRAYEKLSETREGREKIQEIKKLKINENF